MTTLAGVDVRAAVWRGTRNVLPAAIAWVNGSPIEGVGSVSASAGNNNHVITFIAPVGDIPKGAMVEINGRLHRVLDVAGTDDAFTLDCEVVPQLAPKDEMTVSVVEQRPYLVVTRTEQGTGQIAGLFSYNGMAWRTITGVGRVIKYRYPAAGEIQGEVWRINTDGTRTESQPIIAVVS